MTADWPSDVIVGRAGIFDAACELVGHELLLAETPRHRDGDAPSAVASAIDAIADGLDALAGGVPLFLAAERETLLGHHGTGALPAGSVLVMPPQLGIDDELVDGVRRRLAEDQLGLALDEVDWVPGVEHLLELASVVRVDLQRHTAAGAGAVVDRCQSYGIALLAHGLETDADLQLARDLGFDLFQGTAVRPAHVERAGGGSTNVGRLRTVGSLLGGSLDFDEVEEVLQTEPTVTYQIMRLASLGRPGETRRRIASIRDALVIAGQWRVQQWMALLMTQSGDTGASDLVLCTLARARACELLAAERWNESAGRVGFTAGVVSSFEQLLRIPADEIADSLELSTELRDAAFGSVRPLSRLVRDVVHRQTGTRVPPMSGISRREVDAALGAAHRWALDVTGVLAEAA
ncbi:MAG: EAL and HDOD domain-containing protein [Jatrophihabitans sp.]|uniref:EAL and HDOD domain-containing protein n=1 Tax=Jatrophihabitans sp. TaxID=1932789 RepID=UPI003F7DC8C5